MRSRLSLILKLLDIIEEVQARRGSRGEPRKRRGAEELAASRGSGEEQRNSRRAEEAERSRGSGEEQRKSQCQASSELLRRRLSLPGGVRASAVKCKLVARNARFRSEVQACGGKCEVPQ